VRTFSSSMDGAVPVLARMAAKRRAGYRTVRQPLHRLPRRDGKDDLIPNVERGTGGQRLRADLMLGPRLVSLQRVQQFGDHH
jgi:hypothetical protein